jgi:hypothetical protein
MPLTFAQQLQRVVDIPELQPAVALWVASYFTALGRGFDIAAADFPLECDFRLLYVDDATHEPLRY